VEWYVRTKYLVAVVNEKRNPDEGFISTEHFELLTGKSINWEIRKDKYIIVERIDSKIKIYDKYFIVGTSYKYNKKIYKCTHIDSNGTALLNPKCNALSAIASKNTKDWEII